MSLNVDELDRHAHGDFAVDRQIDRRRNGRGVIHEGDDGVFSQTWWPICRSSDVPAGEVVGRNFLDGRVAIFRAADGSPAVVSAYCPHNGADLSVGNVIGGELRCAFHHWCFDTSGSCTRTGSGDPVSSSMRVFRYPTLERFGLIWAFNGEQPLFDLPDLGFPDSELAFHSEIPILDINVEPWVFMCNTADFNHIRCVHGIEFDKEEPHEDIRWLDHGYDYELSGRFASTGDPLRYQVGIRGTNIYYQLGSVNGRWFAFFYPCGLHRPGTLRSYFIIATSKSDGTPEDDRRVAETLEFGMKLEQDVVGQDYEILNTIRFTRGMLTRSDRALAKFLEYLKHYPRSHPGADYIR